jgi:hypothetical protein
MNIAHLSLRSLIFELRHARAFLLWDRAGVIATDAAHRWPALILREATPGQVRLTLGTRAEISLKLEQAHVAISDNKLTLDELIPYSSFLYETTLRVLEINTLTRVSLKTTFIKEYSDIDDAVRDFVATGMTKALDGKHFGIEGKIASPSTVVIRFEGDYLGCANTLQVRKRTSKLDVPVIGNNDFEIITKEHVEFVYDCEYFTTADMNVGQLNATRWIEEAMRVIRRDANTILGG